MAAFGADDPLGLQAIDGRVDVFYLQLAGFPVAGEHGQAGLFPTFAGHGPIFPGDMEQDGRFGQILKRGHELDPVLRFFDRKRFSIVE